MFNNLKRIIAGTLCTFMVITSMVGCGSNKDEASNSTTPTSTSVATESQAVDTAPKPVTISISDYPKETDTGTREIWDNLIKNMNEKYPYITIQPDEYAYDVNTFFPKAASGQLPTLYVSPFTEVSKIMAAGYCADITNAVVESGFDKDMNPDLLNFFKKDNKYYGVPTSGYNMSLQYNVKLWKEAGLVDANGVPLFPKTYEELAQSAKTIKDKTGKVGFFFPTKNNQGGWMFMSIAWSFGTEFEKLVDGKWKAVFNSPEGVAALQYVKDLKWKYDVLQPNILVDAGEGFKLLGTDQAATAFGSFDWANIPVNDYKASKDNQALSSVPSGPAGKVALLGGRAYFFADNATPEQIDAGFKWFDTIGMSAAVNDEQAKSIRENEKIKVDNNLVAGIHGLRIFTGADRVKMEDDIFKEVRNVNHALFVDSETNVGTLRPEEPVLCQELYKTLDSVIQTVLTEKNADPKALLDKAAETFQKDYLDKVE